MLFLFNKQKKKKSALNREYYGMHEKKFEKINFWFYFLFITSIVRTNKVIVIKFLNLIFC